MNFLAFYAVMAFITMVFTLENRMKKYDYNVEKMIQEDGAITTVVIGIIWPIFFLLVLIISIPLVIATFKKRREDGGS